MTLLGLRVPKTVLGLALARRALYLSIRDPRLACAQQIYQRAESELSRGLFTIPPFKEADTSTHLVESNFRYAIQFHTLS